MHSDSEVTSTPEFDSSRSTKARSEVQGELEQAPDPKVSSWRGRGHPDA